MSTNEKHEKALALREGLRDGVPIGLGYLAVSFSLGIAARNVGVTPFQGFLASLFTIASAGEHAAFTLIGAAAAYIEMALVILITNGRYLLMSCAMSQRLDPDMPMIHRVGMGALITDEIFGASMARSGYLRPEYTYGLALSSVLPWAIGTALGIIMGNLLPVSVVSALGVTLYGMFIAIIIPPARKSPIIASIVLVSFVISYFSGILPLVKSLSEGNRIIILTVVLSAIAAILFPVKEEPENA